MAESIYTKAAEIVAERRQKSLAELEKRRSEVFSKIPKLRTIESELDRYGIRMLNLILEGECDEKSAVAAIMTENRQFAEEKAKLLTENGYSENYLDPSPMCPICKDTGYVDNRVCACLKKEIMACALREANLSEKSSEETFENFNLNYYSEEYVEAYGCSPRENMKSILNECKAYARDFPKVEDNLLFCGGCGLGKTYLSSAIANELIKRGVDVLYVSSNALFPILEDMHFGREVNERAAYIIKKLSDCELLILDDLGSEFVTQFTSAELFRLINNRLLSGGKMIVSTNLNHDMLANTYTERIASRIAGSFSILEFLGTDIRKIKKLEKKQGMI